MSDAIVSSPVTGGPAKTGAWVIHAGLALIILQGLRTISHGDFWTHLAAGRWIAQNGIPRIDPLTWMSGEAAWINTHWLYDRLLYGLWGLGGAPLVTLLHIAAVSSAFWLIARVSRPYASPFAVGLALCMSAWLMAARLEVRPELPALLFAALIIRFGSQQSGWKSFAVLLPVQIVWANMTPSFLWGPFIAILYAMEAYFRPPDGQGGLDAVRRPVLLAVLLLAVTCLNPYGPALFGAVVQAAVTPALRDWISPVSGLFQSALSKHLVTLTLLVGAGGLLTCRHRLPLALTGVAVVAAFLVVREMTDYILWFALLAMPLFALSLESIAVSLRRYVADSRQIEAARKMLGAATAILVMMSTFWIVTNRYYTHVGHFASFGLGAVTAAYPSHAGILIEHPAFPAQFYNLPVDGGFLAWQYPGRSSFVDQRGELHARSDLASFIHGLIGHPTEWQAMRARWESDLLILNNAWPHSAQSVTHLRSQDWEILYFDGATTVLARRTDALAPLFEAQESYWRDGLQVLEESRRAYRDRLGGLRRPALSPAVLGAGHLFQARGQYREAAACHSLLLRGAPNLLMAHLNLGICLSQLGDHSAALPHLDRFTRKAPNHPLGWIWLSRAKMAVGEVRAAHRAAERARELDPSLAGQILGRPAADPVL